MMKRRHNGGIVDFSEESLPKRPTVRSIGNIFCSGSGENQSPFVVGLEVDYYDTIGLYNPASEMFFEGLFSFNTCIFYHILHRFI